MVRYLYTSIRATGISAAESRPFHYSGSGSLFKYAESEDTFKPHYSGSGTITAYGTNWFSQAISQSTFFGLEGKAEISGSAEERFVPSTPARTVLFDIGGTSAESTVASNTRFQGIIQTYWICIWYQTHFGCWCKNSTLRYWWWGNQGCSTAKADGNINLFDITGGMTQGVPVFTPSWFSPMGNLKTEELDWGLVTATPTQLAEDWGPNCHQRRDYSEGSRELGILTSRIQLGTTWRRTLSKSGFLIRGRYFTICTDSWNYRNCHIPTFRGSRYCNAAIAYESSGKSGIATHNAWSILLWRTLVITGNPQHTVFGEEGKFTFSSTGNESITPWIPEGSGSLFAMGGSAESSTKAYLQGDYSYLGGTAGQVFSPHIDNTVEITLRTGRERWSDIRTSC